MRHPFELTSAELENLELDFGELLTNEEAAQVGGGGELTTRASKPKSSLSNTSMADVSDGWHRTNDGTGDVLSKDCRTPGTSG